LYLDRRGAALDAEGESLVVRLAGEVATWIPLALLERVVIHGEAVLSSRLLATLWRKDVGLLLISGRHSEPTARLVGWPHDDAALRLSQYQRAVDVAACGVFARQLVAAKHFTRVSSR
jgi:CRISPR-associated protein Cas1